MARSKTLGSVVDALYALREKRLAIVREAGEIEERERELREDLLKMLQEAGTSVARGEVATASRYAKQFARIVDPEKFLAYVVKEKAFELATVSAKTEACRERWETSAKVPGVVPDSVVKISLTKNPRSKK